MPRLEIRERAGQGKIRVCVRRTKDENNPRKKKAAGKEERVSGNKVYRDK